MKPIPRVVRMAPIRAKYKRGPNRYFTDDEVREIRKRLKREPGAKLAREYGVSLRTMYDLKHRASYRDVV